MQRLEVSGAVRPLQGSLGFKGLKQPGVPSFSAGLPSAADNTWFGDTVEFGYNGHKGTEYLV